MPRKVIPDKSGGWRAETESIRISWDPRYVDCQILFYVVKPRSNVVSGYLIFVTKEGQFVT